MQRHLVSPTWGDREPEETFRLHEYAGGATLKLHCFSEEPWPVGVTGCSSNVRLAVVDRLLRDENWNSTKHKTSEMKCSMQRHSRA